MTKLLSSLMAPGGAQLVIQKDGAQVTATPVAIDFKKGFTVTEAAGVVEVNGASPATVETETRQYHEFVVGQAVAFANGYWNDDLDAIHTRSGIVTKLIGEDTYEVTTSGEVTILSGLTPGWIHFWIMGTGTYKTWDNCSASEQTDILTSCTIMAVRATTPTLCTIVASAPRRPNYYIMPTSSLPDETLLWSCTESSSVLAKADNRATLYTHVAAAFFTLGNGNSLVYLVSATEMVDGAYIYGIDLPLFSTYGFAPNGFLGMGSGLNPVEGQKYYLSADEPGKVTLTPPKYPNIRQVVAVESASGGATYITPYIEESPYPHPVVETVTEVSHGLVVGNGVGRDSTGWAVDSVYVLNTVPGVVTKVIDEDTYEVTTEGLVVGLTGLTPGKVHFWAEIDNKFYTWDTMPESSQRVLFEQCLVIAVRAVSATEGVLIDMEPHFTPHVFYDNGTGPETMQFWSANSLNTVVAQAVPDRLATHMSFAYISFNGDSYVVLLEEISTLVERNIFYNRTPLFFPSSGIYVEYENFPDVPVGATTGQKLYLSDTVPGAMTHIPPALRQVLAVVSGVNVNYILPYVESTPITVGTTAPSSPAIGDLWVDTN